MVSPLTLPSAETFSFENEMSNGFGNSENGLSITIKGLAYCFQQVQRRMDCPKSLSNHLEKNLFTEWKTPIDPPTTPAERALAGCKYTEDDFELLRVPGGGSFGRVFLSRLKTDWPSVRL